MSKETANCAGCGKTLVLFSGNRDDNRKIKHGKHAGKYLCVSCSIYDLG